MKIVLLCVCGIVVVVVLWLILGNRETIEAGGKDIATLSDPQEQDLPVEDIVVTNPDGYYGKILEGLREMKPGVDYKKNEVVFLAESSEEAKTITTIIGGSLLQYSDGVAVASISKSVVSLMMELDKRGEDGFEISPNYIYNGTVSTQ